MQTLMLSALQEANMTTYIISAHINRLRMKANNEMDGNNETGTTSTQNTGK